MRDTTTIFILFLVALNVLGQTEQGGHYRKAKIYLKDHKMVKVEDLKISPLTAQYSDSKSNEGVELPIEHISLIKIPKGNHLLEGALFGTATLSLSALLIDLDTDPLGQSREKEAGFYLAMAGSGAVVGALVGIFLPKWRSINLKDAIAGGHLPIHLEVSPQTNSVNLKCTITL